MTPGRSGLRACAFDLLLSDRAVVDSEGCVEADVGLRVVAAPDGSAAEDERDLADKQRRCLDSDRGNLFRAADGGTR